MLDDLEFLSCHSLDVEDTTSNVAASASSSNGWKSNKSLKWTVIGGSIWAGILAIVIVLSCWLCVRLRQLDRAREFVPYGQQPGAVPGIQCTIPDDLVVSREHSTMCRSPDPLSLSPDLPVPRYVST